MFVESGWPMLFGMKAADMRVVGCFGLGPFGIEEPGLVVTLEVSDKAEFDTALFGSAHSIGLL